MAGTTRLELATSAVTESLADVTYWNLTVLTARSLSSKGTQGNSRELFGRLIGPRSDPNWPIRNEATALGGYGPININDSISSQRLDCRGEAESDTESFGKTAEHRYWTPWATLRRACLRNVLSAAFSGLYSLGLNLFSINNLIRQDGQVIVTIL